MVDGEVVCTGKIAVRRGVGNIEFFGNQFFLFGNWNWFYQYFCLTVP